jgi:GNAT superfamily N-acetyltransferase
VIRPAASNDDLKAYVAVWNAVDPAGAIAVEQQRARQERDGRRLYLLAEGDAGTLGCGFAGPSDSPTRGYVAPRVLPEARRRGVGSALLQALIDQVAAVGFESVSSRVDGRDAGSLAFAERFGFRETNRQVEQVRDLAAEPPERDGSPPPGVRFVSVAERPELLRGAYELGLEGWADMATPTPVTVSLDVWLEEEATLPGGSFVALASDEIVGYSGLCRTLDDEATAEDGLTVVRRDWRRRGLASALKRAELAWAARNGIRRVVTWTQQGNEGMRAVNERLGFRYGAVEIDVGRPLRGEAAA